MSTAVFPFQFSGQATADVSGTAQVVFGPAVGNESWSITHSRVKNPGPDIPTMDVYKNFVGDAGFIEGTINAINGSSETVINLLSGDTVIYVFTLCSPLTLCTVIVSGNRMVAM